MAENTRIAPVGISPGKPGIIVNSETISGVISELYKTEDGELSFRRILQCLDLENDSILADAIEKDGRLRLQLGKSITLGRYLETVEDLLNRPEPLDAAIDMYLRSLARSGNLNQHSIESLIAEYPNLEAPIREAVVLNDALWSTARLQTIMEPSQLRELPCGFGTCLEDGSRRYELRNLLGEGSFGEVYLAVDRQLSEEEHEALVSIKILSGRERSDWSRRLLTDEATKARRIDHPNVVRVFDRGVSDENEDFIVYEFVDGGELNQWFRRNKKTLPMRQAISLMIRIARGVHAAHMAGLVHCDLKPGNIVLTSDGQPKVADFGISIRVEEHLVAKLESDVEPELLGNIAFMSPEQYRLESGALTIPTDIYALGGILYYLLTRSLPNGDTPEDIRRTHDPETGRRRPPSLRQFIPDIDRDLDVICQRAMAIQPEHRHGSAAGLADDLEAWMNREPISWTKPTIFRKVKLWMLRKPGLAAMLAALLVLSVISGATFQHLAAVARKERFNSEVLEQAQDQSLSILKVIITKMRHDQQRGQDIELLLPLWVMELLYSNTIPSDAPEDPDYLAIQINVARSLGEKNESGLQKGIWETALGFWLIRSGDYEESEPLLEENLRHWNAILAQDDTWLDHIRALQACAAVNRLADPDRGDSGQNAASDEMLRVHKALELTDEAFKKSIPGTPIHLLVIRKLIVLYGLELLDEPRKRRAVKKRLKAFLK